MTNNNGISMETIVIIIVIILAIFIAGPIMYKFVTSWIQFLIALVK